MNVCEFCNGKRGDKTLFRLIAHNDEKVNGKLCCGKCWEWSIRAIDAITREAYLHADG